MKPPIPWKEDPALTGTEAEAARLLEDAKAPAWPASEQARVWHAAVERAGQRPLTFGAGASRGPGARLALAAALGVVLVVGVGAALLLRAGPGAPSSSHNAQATVLELGAGATLEAAPGSALRLVDGRSEAEPARAFLGGGVATLKLGSARQPGEPPAALVTPHVWVEVSQGVVMAEVVSGGTVLTLVEGAARARLPEGEWRTLERGVPFRAAPARTASGEATRGFVAQDVRPEPIHAPVAAPADPGACAAVATAEQEGCYRRLAQGDGLAAQSALYAWGSLARQRAAPHAEVVRIFDESRRRFPDGVLAPEVSLALLGTHLEAHRWTEAVAEARTFLRQFEGDSRVPRVKLVLAAVLRIYRSDPEGARQWASSVLESTPPPPLEASALWELAQCERALRRPEAARRLWRTLVERHPESAEAAAARRELGP